MSDFVSGTGRSWRLVLLMLPFAVQAVLGFQLDSSPRHMLDSLISQRAFDQALVLVDSGSWDQSSRDKYHRLHGEITLISGYDEKGLKDFCANAVLYQERFTRSYAGTRAAAYYSEFLELNEARSYTAALTAFRIAGYYQSRFIEAVHQTTLTALERADEQFLAGDIGEAVATCRSVEHNIYNYQVLKDLRWHYEATLKKYQEALTLADYEEVFSDTTYETSGDFELSLIAALIVHATEFSSLKPIIISHSTMTQYEQIKRLEHFKATGGISLGLAFSKVILPRLAVCVKAAGGMTNYSGIGEETGWKTSLSATHVSGAVGLRYSFHDQGRFNYYSAMYLQRSQSSVEKEITRKNSQVDTEYYYTAASVANDSHVELQVGMSFLPVSKTQMIYRASLGVRQSLGDPDLFGPQVLFVSISTGYVF